MTTRDIFDSYLQFRIDRAGALTPGKKLSLVTELMEEALQGRVPVGTDKVAQLPLESRSVQAVLAGEPVSMGQTRVRGRMDQSAATAMLARAQELPPLQRGLLVLGLLLIFGLVGFLGFRLITGSKAAMEEPTITPVVEATPGVAVVLSDSAPSKKPNDPASIQVGNTSFVLGRGTLKNGVWSPDQAEWLGGSEVRRVMALPLDGIEEAIDRGDVLRLRTRSGLIVPYEVVEITELQRTQIEVLSSLEPSLVVILYDETAASTRDVVIARLDTQEMGITSEENIYLVSSPAGEINLRERPYGSIVGVLANGTVVEMMTDVEPVNDGGYKWVRVQASYGAEGWVAAQLLAELPDN